MDLKKERLQRLHENILKDITTLQKLLNKLEATIPPTEGLMGPTYSHDVDFFKEITEDLSRYLLKYKFLKFAEVARSQTFLDEDINEQEYDFFGEPILDDDEEEIEDDE